MEHIIIDVTKPITYQAHNIVFAIGRFQALHIGHQHLLSEAKRFFPTRKCGVITFTPDPRDYFSKKVNPKILTYTERLQKFEEIGVEVLIEFVFNETFSQLSKREFLDLMQKMNIDAIVHGQDFHFGNQNDYHHIKSPILHEVSDLQINNTKVASSELAKYLDKGAIRTLNEALNYVYSVTGNVISGRKLARKIGFPTANLNVDAEKILPVSGVYATRTKIDNETYESITHVGPSPTFEHFNQVIETHVFNYHKNLYDKKITVFFYEKIRDVEKFSGIEAVENQIKQDIICVKQYFKT